MPRLCDPVWLLTIVSVFARASNGYVVERQNAGDIIASNLVGAIDAAAAAATKGPAVSAVAASASAYAKSAMAASSVSAYTKPTQQVSEFIAIGDSFTAGVGSNGQPDYNAGSYDCSRYEQAWPYQLQNEDGWHGFNGGQTPVLNFGACTGAKMQDMMDKQLTLGDAGRDVEYHNFGKPQLAVLTISGNDAEFGTAVNDCILRAWLPGDCQATLDRIRTNLRNPDFQTRLIETLVKVAIKGQFSHGADPPQSFQTYISGYIPFWNHDDHGCDTVSWAWWFGNAPITTTLRRQMNDLVDDLNGVIKAAAEGLASLGVFYVDGIQDAYNTHRFCEPDTKAYLEKPIGPKTWFWHGSSPYLYGGEGPNDASTTGALAVQQAILDLLIPDPKQRASVSATNPPWNINPVFKSFDALNAALDKAQGVNLKTSGVNVTDPNGANDPVHIALSEQTKRIFHPKGTAYGAHARAYLAAIKANRSPPGTATTGSTPSGTCSGNQVQGTCHAGSYPSLPPYSGVQQPVCNKADGSAGEKWLRINAKQAQQAAADWCQALAQQKVVLSAQSTSVKPYIKTGGAEKNGNIVLDVLFDVAACPKDKSSSTVDFTKISATECQSNFYTTISEFCAQDSTWANYNKDFTIEGGAFMNDCALWSIDGQPA